MSIKKFAAAAAMLAAASIAFAKTKIVTTIFPEYDWVREIVGNKADDAEISLLTGNGVDLHSYQLSVKDMAKISTADVFICVGGGSDGWADDVLRDAKNKDMKVIKLLDVLGGKVKAEEIAEGMQSDGDEGEDDEHVWLSVRNAKILCGAICDALCQKDSKNAASYRANLASYSAKLDKLDADFAAAVRTGSKDTLLFGDRFPFRYFVDDYGLKYYAAFAGCSAESEASFETIVFLANKLDELGLNSVCQIEGGNGKLARTVIRASKKKGAKILTLGSMQSTTQKDIKNGTTYLGEMQKNLEVLKEALK